MRKLLIATAAVVALSGAANAATCKIGMAEYAKVKTGMTLAQAESAIGCKGEEMSQSETGGFKSSVMTWDGRERGDSLIIIFSNGKLLSKSQFGLK